MEKVLFLTILMLQKSVAVVQALTSNNRHIEVINSILGETHQTLMGFHS